MLTLKVVEQIPGHWKKDVDFVKSGAPFTIRWTNVFKDDTDIIDRFKVYVSTYPGGKHCLLSYKKLKHQTHTHFSYML